jgi:thiol-disulfide isomerase/thioredoxin
VLAPALLLGVACAACGSRPSAPPEEPPGRSTVALRAPADFDFDSLDERPVSAESTRGKPTVIAFVTTGSLPAQAEVNYLVAMAKHDADRVNYAVVALEPRENRELVEIYRKSLAVTFPVAMADAKTLAGDGTFGDMSTVPATVILDRGGRVVWRVAGRVVKSDELRAAMRGL